MLIEGRVEITEFEFIPQTQTSGEGGVIPPTITTISGYFDEENELPINIKEALQQVKERRQKENDLRTDTAIFMMFDQLTPEELSVLPGFRETVEPIFDELMSQPYPPASKDQVKAFIEEARRLGLVRKARGLSTRQYIGALTLSEPIDIQIVKGAKRLLAAVIR